MEPKHEKNGKRKWNGAWSILSICRDHDEEETIGRAKNSKECDKEIISGKK